MLLQQLLLLELRLLNWLLSSTQVLRAACLLCLGFQKRADHTKCIRLRVASGAEVRARLFNYIIYAQSVTRPLVSIGQLKALLDLQFVGDDGPPTLLFCSS